jgi:hypothetical protein
MAWPSETISTDTLQTPPGAVPEGLKIASFTGPESFDAAATPVIRVGSFTIWPMSYYDNRVSLGMVVYDPCGCPVRVVEKPGARYVYRIAGDNGAYTVWGQANQSVTLSADEIGDLLVPGEK